jgi:hypothetical protein
MFDPNTFGSYDASKHPKMLHFQYKGSEDVFRYVLVERIPIGDISSASRRKEGEGRDEGVIVNSYLEREDDRKPDKKGSRLQRMLRNRRGNKNPQSPVEEM